MKTLKKWQNVAIAAALAALVAIPVAYAAGGPGSRGRFMKHMISARVEDAEDYIEATPEQRKVIEQAKDDILAKFEAKMKDKAGHREQWIALLTADRLDTAKIYAEADKRADEIKAMAREIVPEIAKVHAVLTPAQRVKLAEKAKEFHGRRGHHGPGGPGGFGGPGGPEGD